MKKLAKLFTVALVSGGCFIGLAQTASAYTIKETVSYKDKNTGEIKQSHHLICNDGTDMGWYSGDMTRIGPSRCGQYGGVIKIEDPDKYKDAVNISQSTSKVRAAAPVIGNVAPDANGNTCTGPRCVKPGKPFTRPQMKRAPATNLIAACPRGTTTQKDGTCLQG
ncbi:hypothetical protein GCM10011309_08780 [Litorimonas cladophorae]|uniref:Uncharacterized protein n=1 Tax=Litorimonas cladophorae TaxID=1220491 RepID=A0A918KHK7_9PROT|nr:hypothetical protein [Litorimonas cladophorae]GGX61157.1 hypothetical protein GCM10011309_08780 [Litorimonas cladophorae]